MRWLWLGVLGISMMLNGLMILMLGIGAQAGGSPGQPKPPPSRREMNLAAKLAPLIRRHFRNSTELLQFVWTTGGLLSVNGVALLITAGNISRRENKAVRRVPWTGGRLHDGTGTG
jgi:hypothetical protein